MPSVISLEAFRYTLLRAAVLLDVDAALLRASLWAGKGFNRLVFLTLNAVVGLSLLLMVNWSLRLQQYVGQYQSYACRAKTDPFRYSCGRHGGQYTGLAFGKLAAENGAARAAPRESRRARLSALLNRIISSSVTRGRS